MTPEALSVPQTSSRYRRVIFQSPVWKDSTYLTGIILLGISLVVFHIGSMVPTSGRFGPNGFFLLNFFFPVTYLIVLLAKGRLRRGRNGIHPFFLFLIMFLISAYSLNREMSVFEKNVPWFSTTLVLVCSNYIAFIFFNSLPEPLKILMSFVTGIAMTVFAYLALYLFPLYVLSLIAAFAIGISIHTFVPLLFCIYTVVLIKQFSHHTNKYLKPFFAGIFLSLALVSGYVVNWNIEQKKINEVYSKKNLESNPELPLWVSIARDIPNSATTERILKTDLVYSVPDVDQFDFFWRTPKLNFETIYHDPLVMISALFAGPVIIDKNERIAILKSIYDARHEAQERLWSGENLITKEVSTSVKLWPELRMGYTELEVITGHTADAESWSRDQEAIYTFHLPEGGVVTSLSLWINGKEEKGILTTKEKANKAYNTIVGVESRDPSVVHWQEGNTVSVRVFPVQRGKSRKFKIGVTAPLTYDGKNLHYNNLHFQGPSFDEATQNISVDLGSDLDADVPWNFSRKGNIVSKSGDFKGDWSIEIPAPALSSATFNFRAYSYGITPMPSLSQNFSPAKIYLDINSSWTENDFNQIFSMVEGRKVFADDDGTLVEITEANKSRLFDNLVKRNFTLFPFYEIANDESALVISKSTTQSPSVNDLKESRFFKRTSIALNGKTSIHLFNLGNELSPYLKSLREFRAFQYVEGNADKLKGLLSKERFNVAPESDEAISVHSAGIQITRRPGNEAGKAPDHLMRLYAYNHILQRAGVGVLSEKLDDTTLMDEAAEANIVSPFSSLVVLESQEDYDRFDIAASKNSLENASLKSKGAVPEPHEWALIALVMLLLATLKFRPQLFSIRRK